MKVKLVCPNGNPLQTSIQAENESTLGLIQEVTLKISVTGGAKVTLKHAYLPKVGEAGLPNDEPIMYEEITADGLSAFIEFELPDEMIPKFARTRQSISED